MALIPEISGGNLLVRSVGDHGLDEGLVQMALAMDLAREEFQRTGTRVDMLIDMLESEEHKSPEELREIGEWFRPYLDLLSGRIAVVVGEELHFGLTRLFSAVVQQDGMVVQPFYDTEAARRWLSDELPR